MLTTVPTGEQLAEAIDQLNDIVAAIGARARKLIEQAPSQAAESPQGIR